MKESLPGKMTPAPSGGGKYKFIYLVNGKPFCSIMMMLALMLACTFTIEYGNLGKADTLSRTRLEVSQLNWTTT